MSAGFRESFRKPHSDGTEETMSRKMLINAKSSDNDMGTGSEEGCLAIDMKCVYMYMYMLYVGELGWGKGFWLSLGADLPLYTAIFC